MIVVRVLCALTLQLRRLAELLGVRVSWQQSWWVGVEFAKSEHVVVAFCSSVLY